MSMNIIKCQNYDNSKCQLKNKMKVFIELHMNLKCQKKNLKY